MLVGREKEFAQVKSLITAAFEDKSPLCIYISGPPGTGKTATVNEVVQSLQQQKNSKGKRKKSKLEFTTINCALSTAIDRNRKAKILEEKMSTTVNQMLILFDEVDKLLSRNNKFIYTAFNWPNRFPGHVVVIGISNSLDLTERLLSKLKLSYPPHTIVFPAYTSEQLIVILKAHFSSNSSENGDEKAIELCARKVASMTGDVRRALDIAAQSLANIEEQEELPPESVNLKRCLPPTFDKGDVTPKKNACREVLTAINNTIASPCQRSKLPEHPRILLATLMRLVSSSSTISSLTNPFRTPPRTPTRTPTPSATPNRYLFQMTPTHGSTTPNSKFSQQQSNAVNSLSVSRDRLFNAYLLVCEKLMIQPMSNEELDSVYEMLESQAMISLSKSMVGPSQQKASFVVEISLARKAINDNALIASIENMDL